MCVIVFSSVEEWYSVEVPSCRGSSQWISGHVDNRSGVGEEDDKQHRERWKKEKVRKCSVSRAAKDETWRVDEGLFFGAQESMSQCTHVICTVRSAE